MSYFDSAVLLDEIESLFDNCAPTYTLLGNVVFQKKNPTITQDLSRRSIAMSRESVSTHPRRPKAKALTNAVDVVERLHDLTDQVPNARHLRDLHTFSSVTSLKL